MWNVSIEEKTKLYLTRIGDLCERLINFKPSSNPYQFPESPLHVISLTNFGPVNWWNITTTDPQDDEVKSLNRRFYSLHLMFFFQIPMTQLARILDDTDDDTNML